MAIRNNNGINLNNINIRLIPNPQYLQIEASDRDQLVRNNSIIELTPHQIESLEIRKSYDLHRTFTHLSLMNITGDIASGILEGKFILLIEITPEIEGAEPSSFANYFLCEQLLSEVGLSDLFGTFPTISIKISLKSILSVRLDIENHFSFELGGKGGTALVGAGRRPLDFLSGEFSEYFTNAYSPDTTETALETQFDLSLTAATDDQVTVNTGPSMGYKFESNTNFEALKFFFDNYPLFKTPYAWIIDDFNTSLTSVKYRGSVVRILDLVRYDYWSASYDAGLSNFINRKFTDNNPTSKNSSKSDTATQMEMFKLVDFQIKERKAFINVSKYLIRDNLPLIYAQRSSDGEPIPMNAWNTAAQTAYVLTASPQELRIKEMQNPMYQQFLTFMSEQEIADTQKFKGVFALLNPELVTYEFTNIFFGSVDIHKSIYLQKEIVGEGDSYGYSKMGIGYDVYHKFQNINPTPASIKRQWAQDKLNEYLFTPSFKLTSEITFLQVSTGPYTLEEYDSIQRKYANLDQTFTTTGLTLFDTVDSCGQYNDVELGGLPVAEPGSAGNENVAAAAQSLINAGFVYLWGGMSTHAMDCSGFTMWAVRNGGGDSGRRTRFPKGTTPQINWLTNPKNGAIRVKTVDDIQPGDIVFFKTKRCGHCHTGIAKDNTSYWHSNSVKKKGADIGTFARRRPSYIFRLLPMNQEKVAEAENAK